VIETRTSYWEQLDVLAKVKYGAAAWDTLRDNLTREGLERLVYND
jgi:hypothetical protein